MPNSAISIDAVRDYYRAHYPIYQYMGLEVVSASRTHAKCRVPLAPANVNHFGTVHAAIQWAVCETLGGVIVLTNCGTDTPFLGVVRNMHIDFLKPAMSSLTSTTEIDKAEMDRVCDELASVRKADFDLPIELEDSDNNIVARALASYHIRDRALYRDLQPQ